MQQTERFLSTLPSRGATSGPRWTANADGISIHAPLAGSDRYIIESGAGGRNFYPRSPRGERHNFCLQYPDKKRFLSTLPSRGATMAFMVGWCARRISIHAPLAGSDVRPGPHLRPYRDFYPRSPRGERHADPPESAIPDVISIHAPLAGSDIGLFIVNCHLRISIHAPLAGSDPQTKIFHPKG